MTRTPFYRRDPQPLSGYEVERLMIAERLARESSRRSVRCWLRALLALLRRKPPT
ncbi:hypothetical protein [Palleronia sp.]|uniref:hypothetical protein n=1 Tax=Palleronia sp. TaxID=1940284 RepID=UPI0035C8203F